MDFLNSLALVIVLTLLLPQIVYIVGNCNAVRGWWGGAIVWYSGSVSIEAIASSYPSIVVVDPDNGPGGETWSPRDIAMLKLSGAKVLAYLNIGYAEKWRDYWRSGWCRAEHPDWLVCIENPDWEGEYFVKYWHLSAWRSGGWIDILRNEIERILSLGFDGVLLDNIDVYEIWEHPEEYGLEAYIPRIANASIMMVYLVSNLSKYIKSLARDALVFVNIGSALDLLNDSLFLASIDGILREEVWLRANTPVEPEEHREALKWLRYAAMKGKYIVVLDYASDIERIAVALDEARKEGFYIYIALTYELDRLATYIPSYLGIGVATYRGSIYAVWSYRGLSAKGLITRYTVYIAAMNKSTVKRISDTDSDSVYPSMTIDESLGLGFTVWLELKENEICVDYAVIKLESLDIVDKRVIACFNSTDTLYPPSVSIYGDVAHVLFSDGRAIHVSRIDIHSSRILSIDRLCTSDCGSFRSLALDEGIAILWREGDELNLALYGGNGVVWKHVVAEGVEGDSYTMAYLGNGEILVIYEYKGIGVAKVYDLKGRLIATLEGIPIPIPYTDAVVYKRYVLYISMDGISILYRYTNNVVYLGSVNIGPIPIGSIALKDTGKGLVLLRPSIQGNNTLDIQRFSLDYLDEVMHELRFIAMAIALLSVYSLPTFYAVVLKNT